MFSTSSSGPSWNCLVASILWLGVVACLVTMVVLHDDHGHGAMFGWIGCALSAAAATVSIRGFFIRFAKREFDAFTLGREVGRSEDESTVRRLR